MANSTKICRPVLLQRKMRSRCCSNRLLAAEWLLLLVLLVCNFCTTVAPVTPLLPPAPPETPTQLRPFASDSQVAEFFDIDCDFKTDKWDAIRDEAMAYLEDLYDIQQEHLYGLSRIDKWKERNWYTWDKLIQGYKFEILYRLQDTRKLSKTDVVDGFSRVIWTLYFAFGNANKPFKSLTYPKVEKQWISTLDKQDIKMTLVEGGQQIQFVPAAAAAAAVAVTGVSPWVRNFGSPPGWVYTLTSDPEVSQLFNIDFGFQTKEWEVIKVEVLTYLSTLFNIGHTLQRIPALYVIERGKERSDSWAWSYRIMKAGYTFKLDYGWTDVAAISEKRVKDGFMTLMWVLHSAFAHGHKPFKSITYPKVIGKRKWFPL